jgi:radical SAM protein with 4Fe4S-binding SPASM domain
MSLDDNILEDLERSHLASITFSIDSQDATTFGAIRKGCDLHTVWNAVERVVRRKRARRTPFPIVQVNVTLMRRNVESLPATLAALGRLGVNIIKVDYARIHRSCVERGSITAGDSLYLHPELADRIMAQAREAAAASPCRVEFPAPLGADNAATEPASPVSAACQQPWTDGVIWANGNVTPCTGAQEVVWGNLRRTRFEEIWCGPEARRFRSRLHSKRSPRVCRECVCFGARFGGTRRRSWHVF